MTQIKMANIQTMELERRFKKSNKEARARLLKKYGVSSFERLKELATMPKSSEVKLTMTELSKVLLNNTETTLTVSFQKPSKIEHTVERLMKVWELTPPLNIKKALKTFLESDLKGETRVAKGTHNNKMDAFGRLYFTETTVELDKSRNSDNRMILISLNNLNWVEVNKVKYILK